MDTPVDRNHKVSSESWDSLHTRHYPMHYVWPLGWRYYPDHNDPSGRVHFMFKETAITHLQGRIKRGE